MSAALAGVERIDVRALPTQRWKNGAGTSREVARGPADASFDDFDWRISLAEIERTAREGLLMPPKSTFFTPKPITGLVLRSIE